MDEGSEVFIGLDVAKALVTVATIMVEVHRRMGLRNAGEEPSYREKLLEHVKPPNGIV